MSTASRPGWPVFDTNFGFGLMHELAFEGRLEEAAALVALYREADPGLAAVMVTIAGWYDDPAKLPFRRACIRAAVALEPEDERFTRTLAELPEE